MTVSEISDLIAAAAAVAQFIVAIVIAIALHRLTKSISTAEHRREINNAWQQYNLEILNNQDVKKYIKENTDIKNDKDIIAFYLMFIRLNIIYEVWYGEKSKFIDPHFSSSILNNQLRLISQNDKRALEFCLASGYSQEFVEFICKGANIPVENIKPRGLRTV